MYVSLVPRLTDFFRLGKPGNEATCTCMYCKTVLANYTECQEFEGPWIEMYFDTNVMEPCISKAGLF